MRKFQNEKNDYKNNMGVFLENRIMGRQKGMSWGLKFTLFEMVSGYVTLITIYNPSRTLFRRHPSSGISLCKLRMREWVDELRPYS